MSADRLAEVVSVLVDLLVFSVGADIKSDGRRLMILLCFVGWRYKMPYQLFQALPLIVNGIFCQKIGNLWLMNWKRLYDSV